MKNKILISLYLKNNNNNNNNNKLKYFFNLVQTYYNINIITFTKNILNRFI